MKLNNLSEYIPLQLLELQSTNKNYFATNRAALTPPKPQSGFHGGNYGAQLKPRHKQYFGGAFGK